MNNWLKQTIALVFLIGFRLEAQNDRDFTGTWLLNTAQSETSRLPEPPAKRIQIDQKGATIHCVSLDPTAALKEWSYRTDGQSVRQSTAGLTTNSATKWEGSALLINTIVDGPGGNYTLMDRWRLSKDGNRLTMERQIVRRQGEIDSTLIYEKEGALKPPVLITTNAAAASTPVPNENYVVAVGTRVPLVLLTPVSTKHSHTGDSVYLETTVPVTLRGKIVIPTGSHVIGQLREVKQADRAKGKSEMRIIFDTITLPNGVTRDFHSRMSGSDAQAPGTFDREEGTIQGNGRRTTDARRTAQAGAAGASVGTIAGGAAGHLGMGAGIGAAAGAVAGLAGTLLTRGPDVTLAKGSTIEMVLDRDVSFTAEEIADIR
jgi:outer membrane lipoprotein SlyB